MNFIQQALLYKQRPLIMGILNVTPDSFSDGGKFNAVDKALCQVEIMLQQGADIIDIGGESTRPGAQEVALQEELDRVLPVIEAIKQRLDCRLSLDTCKADVMQQGIRAGVDMINDVCGLQNPKARAVVAKAKLPVCIMHMQGQPRTMQQSPHYNDVVHDVIEFLQMRTVQCMDDGIDAANIIVDPGFGFGKNLIHNLSLMQSLEQISALPYAVLVGVSRKSMIDKALNGRSVDQRLPASLALAALATYKGASILRVHDVAETYDVVAMTAAVASS